MKIALEILFNLLSLARRAPSVRALHRQLRNRQLYDAVLEETPGFGFWLKLAQAAALLDEAAHPTLFVPEWLEMSLEAQILHLLESWVFNPASSRNQETRRNLISHLLEEGEISPTERRELTGLQALGLAQGARLSPEGRHLLEGMPLNVPLPRPWHTNGNFLWVPYPPDFALLWELEAYLDPVDPGVYALDAPALRLARQRAIALETGDIVETLPALLARGLALPTEEAGVFLGELAYALDDQPTLAVHPGYLLAFSDVNELKRLRRVRGLLPYLDGILSSHHLFLEQAQADPVLQWLNEHDLFAPTGQTVKPPEGPLTQTEQAALLAILLFAEGSHLFGNPPGLLTKLSLGLPLPVRAAAAHKAWKALEKMFPRPAWVAEAEPPEVPEAETLLWLERAIAHETPVDFLYRKARGYQAQPRHVTPLLIEQRGLRFYLIGYCHTRRANRMFRVDRMVSSE